MGTWCALSAGAGIAWWGISPSPQSALVGAMGLVAAAVISLSWRAAHGRGPAAAALLLIVIAADPGLRAAWNSAPHETLSSALWVHATHLTQTPTWTWAALRRPGAAGEWSLIACAGPLIAMGLATRKAGGWALWVQLAGWLALSGWTPLLACYLAGRTAARVVRPASGRAGPLWSALHLAGIICALISAAQ